MSSFRFISLVSQRVKRLLRSRRSWPAHLLRLGAGWAGVNSGRATYMSLGMILLHCQCSHLFFFLRCLQTLARVTNYNPALNILTFQPLPELAALRASPPLFSSSSLTIGAGQKIWLGNWANSVGNQSEFGATFIFPANPVTFGVQVCACSCVCVFNGFHLFRVRCPKIRLTVFH